MFAAFQSFLDGPVDSFPSEGLNESYKLMISQEAAPGTAIEDYSWKQTPIYNHARQETITINQTVDFEERYMMAQEEEEDVSMHHTLKTHSVNSHMPKKRQQSAWSEDQFQGQNASIPGHTPTDITKITKPQKAIVSGFEVSGEAIQVPKSQTPASVLHQHD